MSLTSQALLANATSRLNPHFASTDFTTAHRNLILNPSTSLSFKLLAIPLHFRSTSSKSPGSDQFEPFKVRRPQSHLRVFEYGGGGTVGAVESRAGNRKLDTFLVVCESLCLVSSAVLSIALAVSWAFSKLQRGFVGLPMDGIRAWQAVMLVGAVAIGAWLRRRQWRRLASDSVSNGASEVHLVERIENLEVNLQNSARIVRVLSRQLEKLGIRFRITRKALKGPLAETTALAQKNSEATRAIALQEDILEKELGEIQKVLMAMQDQQQKQLELIIAVAKSGKLWDRRQVPGLRGGTIDTKDLTDAGKKMEIQQTQPVVIHKGTNNDRA